MTFWLFSIEEDNSTPTIPTKVGTQKTNLTIPTEVGTQQK